MIDIAGIVWGGPLESLHYTLGENTAFALFLHARDCRDYYESTANGIPYPGQQLRIVTVELGNEIDPISSQVRDAMTRGCTRCIRVIGLNNDWSVGWIRRYAEGTLSGSNVRKLENMTLKVNERGVSALHNLYHSRSLMFSANSIARRTSASAVSWMLSSSKLLLLGILSGNRATSLTSQIRARELAACTFRARQSSAVSLVRIPPATTAGSDSEFPTKPQYQALKHHNQTKDFNIQKHQNAELFPQHKQQHRKAISIKLSAFDIQ